MYRILLLNDEPNMLDALSAVLQMAGHESVTAQTNEKAITILRTQRIDLLVQDIGRPGMDGWEFAKLMKADPRTRDIPILITSGYSYVLHPENHALVDGYLSLPFNIEEFLATVDQILSKKSQAVAK